MSSKICVKCGLRMEFIEAGVWALEFKNRTKTEPYKLWKADLYRCWECKVEFLGAFAARPFSEDFEKDFYELLNKIKNRGERIIEFY